MLRFFQVVSFAVLCYHFNLHTIFLKQTKLDRLPSMEAANLAFGHAVKLSRNTNVIFSGRGNEGTVSNNCNGRVDATSSVVNLHGNTNINLLAKNANVSIRDCSNLNTSATGKSKLNLSDDTNARISLDGSGSSTELESKGNTNSEIKSTGSVLKLLKNTNVKVELTEGTLTAEDNVNLRVMGFGGTAIVNGTTDHEVSRANGDDLINKLDFSFKPQRGISIGGMFSSVGRIFGHNPSSGPNTNDVKITLEYVDEASILRDEYKLGIFQFQLAPTNPQSKTEYVLRMDEQSLDRGSLEMQRVLPSQVILSGFKNGVKQTLSVSTPPDTGRVDGTKENFKINLLGAHASNI